MYMHTCRLIRCHVCIHICMRIHIYVHVGVLMMHLFIISEYCVQERTLLPRLRTSSFTAVAIKHSRADRQTTRDQQTILAPKVLRSKHESVTCISHCPLSTVLSAPLPCMCSVSGGLIRKIS
jgi:hypothetical protein